MAAFNKCLFVGNVTRDPELRYTNSGVAVTDLAIAINEKVKKGDQWVEETTYLDVTIFGKQAETAGEYLRRGSGVLLECRAKLDTWEQDGQKRSKIKFVADRMQMLGGDRGQSSSRGKREEEPAPW